MTIKEAENFYKQDNKEYNLTSKEIIKDWINDIIEIEKINILNVKYPENYMHTLVSVIKNIYNSIKDIKELQELIDFLTIWYEIKYSNKYFEGYKTSLKLQNAMSYKEMLERLNDKNEDLMLCNYRSGGWSALPIIINDKVISEDSIFFGIDIKNNINGLKTDYYISINADSKTGLLSLKYNRIGNFIDKKYKEQGFITLEELYNELEKCNEEIEYNSLKKTILDKKLREKIRKEILELVSLKLLYSENTIPEYGYERAKRFIDEMNREMNINLKTDKIDKIMNKNYSNSKKLIKEKQKN